jgi:hypothetical protein
MAERKPILPQGLTASPAFLGLLHPPPLNYFIPWDSRRAIG